MSNHSYRWRRTYASTAVGDALACLVLACMLVALVARVVLL
jgi:hypothetical protein